jgi:D-glycero-D-manno-heptose 1,7-bisphosphate phosphatase
MTHLVLFDLDDTLIEGHLEEVDGRLVPSHPYDRVEVLPNRLAVLRQLREAGVAIAIVTNQGGAAFGHQTVKQTVAKLWNVAASLEFPAGSLLTLAPGYARNTEPAAIYAALAHPNAHDLELRCARGSADDLWRKPGPGMIGHARHAYGAARSDTIMVGDLPSDQQAAEAAGVAYFDADDFFGGAGGWRTAVTP